MGRKLKQYEGPDGPQAMRGYLRMFGKDTSAHESFLIFLKENGISFGTGMNWLYHGNIPRRNHLIKVSNATKGWVTSTEWYRDRPAQERWLKHKEFWT